MYIHTYILGLGDIENIELQLLQQRHCDYCHNIALEYSIANKAKHHCTCRNYNGSGLETSLFVGFSGS